MATEVDKVNTGALATILTVGALAMLGISAAITALVRYEADAQTSVKGGTANLRALHDLRLSHEKILAEPPRWVDRPTHKVGVPVDRAMKLVLEDLQKDPNSATPPPPDPKAEKPEAEPPAEDEQTALEPTEDGSVAEEPAAPGSFTAVADAGRAPAAPNPAAKLQNKPPTTPQAPPAPAPTPTPAPQVPPSNAP
jgi:hypothetical protein